MLEKSFSTPKADDFLKELKFVQPSGNLEGSIKCGENKHTMTVNHPHKRSRGLTQDERLEKLKNDLVDVKERIRANIVENVRSQCNAETFYYCWSGLDLKCKMSKEQRKGRLNDIISIFCTTKVFTVQRYTNAREEETEDDDSWEGFSVTLTYPPLIPYRSVEVLSEFDEAFKVIQSLYITEVTEARVAKREIKQLNVWKSFLSSHYLEFPAVGHLVQIMLATAGNTSPLERGYTHLEMIASKRRNHLTPAHLETLFLLTTLKIPLKKGDDYMNEARRL